MLAVIKVADDTRRKRVYGRLKFPEDGVTHASALKAPDKALSLTPDLFVFLVFLFFFLLKMLPAFAFSPFCREKFEGGQTKGAWRRRSN